MKNVKLIYLAAGLIAISASQLTHAEDPKPAPSPNREEAREKFKNLTPEEREAKMKEFREKHPEAAANMEKRGEGMRQMIKDLGLDAEELKKLPEAERRAKIKAAADKKMTELNQKKADGTISDSEKEMLKKLEQTKKFMEEHPGGPGQARGPGSHGKPEPKKSDK